VKNLLFDEFQKFKKAYKGFLQLRNFDENNTKERVEIQLNNWIEKMIELKK